MVVFGEFLRWDTLTFKEVWGTFCSSLQDVWFSKPTIIWEAINVENKADVFLMLHRSQ